MNNYQFNSTCFQIFEWEIEAEVGLTHFQLIKLKLEKTSCNPFDYANLF